MKSILKIFLKSQLITSCCYGFYYFIKTFAIWKFENPFNWIIDIPTYRTDVRACIIIAVLFWYGILNFLIFINQEESNQI